MDIKTMIYKSLEWYIINETSTEKLLFLKDSLSEEIIKQVFDEYFHDCCVQFNPDKTKIWWEDSYIRERLNKVFLNKFLDVNDLNIMRTTLKLNGEARTTEDFVRLITTEEVKKLPLEILKTDKLYGYWTMNPHNFYSNNAFAFFADDYNSLAQLWNSSKHDIGYSTARPIISLKRKETVK